MDDDAFENLKDAFRAAPSTQLGRVIIEEYIRREELDAAGLLYRSSIDEHPDLQNDEWDTQFLEQEPEDLRAKLKVVEKDESVINIDTFRAKSTTFDDVVGLDKIKKQIHRKIILPFQKPSLFDRFRKKAGGGILLFGPPGCGKTLLARATAGEIEASFISVGISDVLEMWIGSSEKNLHEVFEKARSQTPCVLFFDEVDALGASRSDMRQSAGRQLINQFLSELDGVKANNDGLLIIGATNAPWHMDPAFRRPGRFDRIIFVEPPDQSGREAILQIMLAGKPLGKLDLAAVAKKTDGFSGADLQAVVDICVEEKLKSAFSSGVPEPIHTKDLIKASKVHKPTTREWFNTARNYALYANESGLYDDILSYLKIKK
ncbi:MAG: ATP-binding protein [Saprospiraceae bacterium]|nr:ATP-binding protein [Saprospiraceae bacterium]